MGVYCKFFTVFSYLHSISKFNVHVLHSINCGIMAISMRNNQIIFFLIYPNLWNHLCSAITSPFVMSDHLEPFLGRISNSPISSKHFKSQNIVPPPPVSERVFKWTNSVAIFCPPICRFSLDIHHNSKKILLLSNSTQFQLLPFVAKKIVQ